MQRYFDCYAHIILRTIYIAICWICSHEVYLDVQKKFDNELASQYQIKQKCADDWYANQCDGFVVPMLKDYCPEKALCMNRDVDSQVKTLSVVTNLVAEALNSFTTELTWKSMALLGLILLLLSKYVSKYLLKYCCKKSNPQQVPIQVSIEMNNSDSQKQLK